MFKCFKFIDDMMKQLNEAVKDDAPENNTEMETEDSAEEMSNNDETEIEEGDNKEEMSSEPKEDPSQIADADAGVFVSPIAKANLANMMLKFLKDKKPDIIIPTQFETVTTENADAVIDFVKNTDVIVDDSFGDELNGI